MSLFGRIERTRTVKFWDHMTINATSHFHERCMERGINCIDGIRALIKGKITRIRNGCYKITHEKTTVIARPIDSGYLLVTIYSD